MVGAALRRGAARLAAASVPSPDFDARLLLRFAAGWTMAELVARSGDPLDPEAERAFDDLVTERAARRPLQHLVGEVEFFGLPLAVGPGALIPRPETEILVEAALARFSRTRRRLRIADVGCGTGAIALALAEHLPNARLVGLDRSPAALALAAENVRRCRAGRRVRLVHGDLLTCFGNAALGGVVANLPYIPDGEFAALEPEVRDHEPRLALAGGPDGLDPLRRLAPQAARALAPGGALFVEIGAGQADAATGILTEAGFGAVERHPDLGGLPRVLAARPPQSAPQSGTSDGGTSRHRRHRTRIGSNP